MLGKTTNGTDLVNRKDPGGNHFFEIIIYGHSERAVGDGPWPRKPSPEGIQFLSYWLNGSS